MAARSSVEGKLHYFPPNLSCFELSRPTATDQPINTLLWIGGLFDTYLSVSYPVLLSSSLPQSWALALLCLSSSGTQWGTSTLDRDRSELATVISYFRKLRPSGQIFLMGHSTGCQDALHYVSAPGQRPPVDGIILQAPVSDREALDFEMGRDRKAEVDAVASTLVSEGKGEDCLPSALAKAAFGKPMGLSANRWLSLSSPDGNGQDDFFSSDTSDERHRRSFGRIGKGVRALFVYCEEDTVWLPKGTRVEDMLARWMGFAEEGGTVVHLDSTRVLKGASHNLNGNPEEVVQELIDRVLRFIKDGRADS